MPTTGEFRAISDYCDNVEATSNSLLSRSTTPNIEPRMIQVNGDMRIGFFAKQDIAARSEVRLISVHSGIYSALRPHQLVLFSTFPKLFFNYEYNWTMDNELLYKPDHSVKFPWMRKK